MPASKLGQAAAPSQAAAGQQAPGGDGSAGGGQQAPGGDGSAEDPWQQEQRAAEIREAQRLRATEQKQIHWNACVQYDRADLTVKLRLEQRRAADQQAAQAAVLRAKAEEREEVRKRLEATNRGAQHAAVLVTAIEACVLQAQDPWERHLGREGKGVGIRT